jgi:hypothetical protein
MWTDTKSHEVVHRLWTGVDFLLKVLGTTGPERPGVVHSPGDKPGGYPVDSRWTTVDNRDRLDDCGRRPGFVPRLPTCESPVDNPLTCTNVSSPHYAQDR